MQTTVLALGAHSIMDHTRRDVENMVRGYDCVWLSPSRTNWGAFPLREGEESGQAALVNAIRAAGSRAITCDTLKACIGEITQATSPPAKQIVYGVITAPCLVASLGDGRQSGDAVHVCVCAGERVKVELMSRGTITIVHSAESQGGGEGGTSTFSSCPMVRA